MPAADAELLEIKIRTGGRILTRGIGGEAMFGYQRMVKMQIGPFRVCTPVIFVENVVVPRILGREGIFSHFGIVFDEAKHRVRPSKNCSSSRAKRGDLIVSPRNTEIATPRQRRGSQ